MTLPSQTPGLYAAARRVLLDALEALEDHLSALILVGAQAVYLHAGESSTIADPPYTTDGDLGIDPSVLEDHPLLAGRLAAADFTPATNRDPSKVGTWEKLVRADEHNALTEDMVVAVDLLVPEGVSGAGRRGARLGPHGKNVAAKSPGLEAVLVDHSVHRIAALEQGDPRGYDLRVAGPAALLVARVHKVADRIVDAERGRIDRLKGGKDLLDIIRLYEAQVPTEIASRLRACGAHDVAAQATQQAIGQLLHWTVTDPNVAVSYIPEQSTAAATANLRTFFTRYIEELLRELQPGG